jgi:chromosomal replication initiation ATPase DnaA
MQVAGHELPDRPTPGGDRRTARFLGAVVASAFDVPVEVVRSARRGPAPVAFCRQVAMYLAHTRLGLSFSAAGAMFGRDRTTAAHACKTVEDCRDDPQFDATLEFLERAIDLWPQLSRAADTQHDRA